MYHCREGFEGHAFFPIDIMHQWQTFLILDFNPLADTKAAASHGENAGRLVLKTTNYTSNFLLVISRTKVVNAGPLWSAVEKICTEAFLKYWSLQFLSV